MASFTCHVVCVTKRLRLERLVRRQLARMVHSPTRTTRSPTPEPNTTTPGTHLAGTPGASCDRACSRRAIRCDERLLPKLTLPGSHRCSRSRCERGACCRLGRVSTGRPCELARTD